MIYLISGGKLQQLNVIVGEKGGVIPSEVSDALGAMQAAYAASNTAEAQKQFNIAVEANKKNGAAWAEVQQWHNGVKAGAQISLDDIVDDTPPGQPAVDPGPPVGSIVPFPDNDPNNTHSSKYAKNLHQGVIYSYPGSGLKKCSFAIGSGGYPCFLSYDPNNMGPGQAGGTPWVPSPDGEWTVYIMYKADPGRVQDVRLDIFPA